MMNGRHLPAGQAMQPEMGRRRQQYHANQHQHQHQQYPHPQQQYSPGTPMYNNNGYIQPYSNPYYSQHMPQQYHNPIPPHQYAQYQPYGRSPPPPMHQQYTPIPQYSNSPSVTRPQQSPAIVSTPYHPPPPPQTQPVTQGPPPPPVQTTPSIQAPSSTQSSHTLPVPLTPPTPQLSTAPPPSPPVAVSAVPFRAPLPWFSRPDLPWPERQSRKKKRRAPIKGNMELHPTPRATEASKEKDSEPSSTESAVARPETPSTNRPLSEETDSTTPTTPSSYVQTSVPAGDATPHGDTTPIAPKPRSSWSAVPIIPALPKTLSPTSQKTTEPLKSQETPSKSVDKENVQPANSVAEPIISEDVKTASPAVKVAPKSWAALLQSPTATSTGAPSDVAPGAIGNTGFAKNAESLAEALRSFNAESAGSKVAFLKPRGLVNTGNMCYMNSVLQVLVSCLPFYDFLDQVGKRAVHSFKSDTPLIDAMIMFMREFPVIDSAISVDQLRLRLKDGELEQYGEAFSPDFVYNVINKLPRFSSMRRGHQQDAEEFLGFLLEGLHDECVQVMRASSASSASNRTSAATTPMNGPSSPASERGSTAGSVAGDTNGWLEVGPKQKAAVTRSSGTIITGSPVTKIFGGNLRSELRVPGLKDSVTLEPYQPLQLDIGSPNVNNIVDALKGLTGSEALHGDFKSPKGPNVTATKQVFIETVPPVLILHLKRFQYDNAGGTQKIWKKIGYPLELEIPKEVFPRQKRSVYAHGGLPKYRLIAVVYHHGNNASGGHYTVDVRRQDGREWIRLDDTVIRRVRSEDVAEGGSEEDPKVLATALEAHKKDIPTSSNPFATIDDDAEGEDGWKQVNGPSSGAASGGKKWSSVVNGASTPKSKSDKFSVKDNKVAYLLFYQKI